MTFLTLDQTTKKWLLLFLLCLFSFWLFSAQATASASGTEKMYQVTEAELNQLQTNLNRLAQISVTQQQESKRLQDTLIKSEQELAMLKNQLLTSKEQLTQAQNSLDSANKLLATYAEEEKRKRLKIKAQRNFWICVAVATLTTAIYCHNR